MYHVIFGNGYPPTLHFSRSGSPFARLSSGSRREMNRGLDGGGSGANVRRRKRKLPLRSIKGTGITESPYMQANLLLFVDENFVLQIIFFKRE